MILKIMITYLVDFDIVASDLSNDVKTRSNTQRLYSVGNLSLTAFVVDSALALSEAFASDKSFNLSISDFRLAT